MATKHYGKPFASYKKPTATKPKPSTKPKPKPASPKMTAAKKRLAAKKKSGAIAGTKIKRNTKKSSEPIEYYTGSGIITGTAAKVRAKQKKQAKRISKMFPR